MDSMDTAERRRKALSPDGDGQGSMDDRLRGRAFENPTSNMFWNDMDDKRKFSAKGRKT